MEEKECSVTMNCQTQGKGLEKRDKLPLQGTQFSQQMDSVIWIFVPYFPLGVYG